jgi:hypothetical protein
MLEPGIHELHGESLAAVVDRLDGWTVYVLPEGIVDKRSLIRGVRDTVPLDPPLSGDDNWDAFLDSLRGGIEEAPGDRIAIVWPGARRFADPAPYANALDILRDVVATVGNPEFAGEDTKALVVVLT